MKPPTPFDLLSDIHTLKSELTRFEEKYGLLTETFYAWYLEGNEPENDAWVMDFSEWAGLYKSLQILTDQYNELLKKQLRRDKRAIVRQFQSHAPISPA
ncbi:MAG: hypothetical protein HUU38_15120 [Anaerolineales bacterium]|nr:hypothetical protein [Anaerolineales bacterium]